VPRLKTALRTFLSLAAALLLLWGLAVWGDVSAATVAATLRRIPVGTWCTALAVHCGIYAARSLRFQMLMPAGERPSFGAVLAVSAAHNLAAYVLPARAGEATFVLYLKGSRGVSTGAGLASLVVSRMLDLATLSAALAIATAWLVGARGWTESPATSWFAVGLLALCAGLLFYASFAGKRLVGLAQRLVRLLGLGRSKLARRLIERSEHLGDTLQLVREAGGIPTAVLLSLVVWGGVFLFYAILAGGFGLPENIGFVEAAFGSSIAVMTNILPINSLAGFGTQEWGWAFGFGLLGVGRELAISTGVGVHLVQLANVCGLGLLGHLGMALWPKRPAAPRPSE